MLPAVSGNRKAFAAFGVIGKRTRNLPWLLFHISNSFTQKAADFSAAFAVYTSAFHEVTGIDSPNPCQRHGGETCQSGPCIQELLVRSAQFDLSQRHGLHGSFAVAVNAILETNLNLYVVCFFFTAIV